MSAPLENLGNTDTSRKGNQCSARSKRSGERCRRRTAPGATVCATHGGSAPQVKAKAEQRHALAVAAEEVALWGGRRDILPAAAMLELAQYKAAEVDYWRAKVAALQESDLLWSRTKVKTGGDDYGITEEARPHAALVNLHKAEDMLERFLMSCHKMGIDEELVKLAILQGSMLVEFARQVALDLGAKPEDADRVVLARVSRMQAALGGGDQ